MSTEGAVAEGQPAPEGPAPEPLVVPPGVSIANHPRARASVRRARARVALIAFALVLLLCLNAGVPAEEAVLRALGAGVIAHLCTWAIALMLWKQVLLSEVRAAHARRQERRRVQLAAAAERRAALAAEEARADTATRR